MTFPAGVAAAFFFVVWHRPYVLYAPRDYTKNASLPSFVEAMTIAQRNRNRVIMATTPAGESVVVNDVLPLTAAIDLGQVTLYVSGEDYPTGELKKVAESIRLVTDVRLLAEADVPGCPTLPCAASWPSVVILV